MNNYELKRLQIMVKKRYDDNDMDYKTFDFDSEIDNSLSYGENKRLIKEKLFALPEKVTRQEAMAIKEQNNQILAQEIEGVEKQAKLMFEEQLDRIANMPFSVLLDNLYLVPKEFIKMVLKGKARGLLLYGEAGLGKSFNVKRQLRESKLREGIDYNFISGHITPMQFYKKLFYNRDKLIILDDINILESKINLNMLKAALNDNGSVIEYSSSALRDIPSSFPFTGRIIILLNSKPEKSEHLKAVEDRILHYHLKMDYKTKILCLYDIAKADYKGLDLGQRQEIAEWIKSNTNEATKNLSIRLLFTCFEFYKWNKTIWQELAKKYIVNDKYATLIIQGCSNQEWIETTGFSIRTMQRYKSQIRQNDTKMISASK